MEKLNLDKFKNFGLTDTQMSNHLGGLAQGSSYTESCSTNPTYSNGNNMAGGDEQTDYYSDACHDGDYSYVCSSTSYTYFSGTVYSVENDC